MSRTTKRWITAASVLVALGLVLFTVALFACGFDFSKLGTIVFETNTYEVSASFSDISLRGDTEDILFVPSKNGECSVVCTAAKGVTHDVSVADGMLTIRTVDNRAWYEHIGIFTQSAKITVYLPQGAYGALSLDTDTGDIKLSADFTFESMDVRTDTGDITSSASVTGAAAFETDTGDISMNGISAGSLRLSVTTGDVKLTNVTCENLHALGDTSDLILRDVIVAETLSAETDTGDIKLEACDAGELFLVADTGDIGGTLLTEKVFLAETDTGDIDVPNSITGGRCEIRTDTGDIEFRIGN